MSENGLVRMSQPIENRTTRTFTGERYLQATDCMLPFDRHSTHFIQIVIYIVADASNFIHLFQESHLNSMHKFRDKFLVKPKKSFSSDCSCFCIDLYLFMCKKKIEKKRYSRLASYAGVFINKIKRCFRETVCVCKHCWCKKSSTDERCEEQVRWRARELEKPERDDNAANYIHT